MNTRISCLKVDKRFAIVTTDVIANESQASAAELSNRKDFMKKNSKARLSKQMNLIKTSESGFLKQMDSVAKAGEAKLSEQMGGLEDRLSKKMDSMMEAVLNKPEPRYTFQFEMLTIVFGAISSFGVIFSMLKDKSFASPILPCLK